MYRNLANLKDLFEILLKHWQLFLQKIIKFVNKIVQNLQKCEIFCSKKKKDKMYNLK
jgi:hypothetical protein